LCRSTAAGRVGTGEMEKAAKGTFCGSGVSKLSPQASHSGLCCLSCAYLIVRRAHPTPKPFGLAFWLFSYIGCLGCLDGYRVIGMKTGKYVNIYSMDFKRFNQEFLAIYDAFSALFIKGVIVDGEIGRLNPPGGQTSMPYKTARPRSCPFITSSLIAFTGKAATSPASPFTFTLPEKFRSTQDVKMSWIPDIGCAIQETAFTARSRIYSRLPISASCPHHLRQL
jgi:hypothetical protein